MIHSNDNGTEGIMYARSKMSRKACREYLEVMQGRYAAAGHRERTALLDEMERMTGLGRKTLIRLMSSEELRRRPRKRERGCVYGEDVRHVLSVIAESFDYICAERLHGNLLWMGQHLEARGELRLTPELEGKLGRISTSTIRRLLHGLAKDEYYLPRAKPKSPNPLSRTIPMKRLPWDEAEPGHFEVDLVLHTGSDASGEFACSLHMVDVATGWSEIAAILGRSQLVVADAFSRILSRLPFPVLQLHPDNGSEFLNHHLLRLWQEWVPGLTWSRSRPYEKNDNRFVEQKNSSIIRAYMGYQRLDTVTQVRTMNEFYEKLRLYYNFFQPVMRLADKHFLPLEGGGSRLRRSYAQAMTPLDRLCATSAISESVKSSLLEQRQSLNPRQLRVEVHDLADAILRLPKGTRAKEEQNVYLTLFRQAPQTVPV